MKIEYMDQGVRGKVLLISDILRYRLSIRLKGIRYYFASLLITPKGKVHRLLNFLYRV